MAHCGMPYVPCGPFFNYTYAYIQRFKPDRIVFVNNWFYEMEYDKTNLNAPRK